MNDTKSKSNFKFNNVRLNFILKGIVIGFFVGVIVSSFRWLIQIFLTFVQNLYRTSHTHPWILLAWLGISVVLSFLIGRLIKSEPQISGSGIPQVEGQLRGELTIKWWPVLWKKFVGGVGSIGSGLFLGREGPSIQLGAAIGQGIAEFRNAIGSEKRILIACGAAAGLSAAFNAPIAATIFVLEEIYHNFSPLIWMTALSGAVTADLVSLNIFGMVPVLHLNYARTLPIHMYWHLLILGIILGLLGYVYQQVLLKSSGWYQHLPIPRWLDGIVPFVLVLPIGYLFPQFLGGGNQIILGLNQGQLTLYGLIGLFFLRFIFSMVSYGSGLPGGIFLPILCLGAIIGAIYGIAMIDLHLLPAVYLTNLIIFSMAGYFAGIGKAPFTAILLVTEMVGSLHHLLPLAILSLVSFVVVDVVGGEPIYESLLNRLIVHKEINQIHHSDRLEIPIFAESALDNRPVRDMVWPKESLLISIRRGDQEIIPHGDTIMRAGDTLIVLTDHANRAKVRQEIQEAAKKLPNLNT